MAAKAPTIRLRGDTLDATLVGGQSTRVDQELVAYFDRRFADFKSELKSELKAELKSDLESELVPEIRAEIVRVPRSSRRRFAPRSRPARRRRAGTSTSSPTA